MVDIAACFSEDYWRKTTSGQDEKWKAKELSEVKWSEVKWSGYVNVRARSEYLLSQLSG